ncbi:trihelix transcription factor ASIL1-like [Oryza brachyantha]|uniref:trihelix transcription factor ASIL1-like n=1 Tax=Oryza brachyantha TaxID=4533 RepID=UPI001ADCB754|nr:trihelix transcription factor ASIL1-like [Oryza brachyantha]
MATRRRAAGAAAAPQPPAWTPEPWSDGETSALLDAWGPRHIRAAGGALRPGDWRACAAAVTARRAAAGRAPRTIDQCKNRMDYLKKRLKAERSRSTGGRAPPPPLQTPVDRLRALLRLAPSVSSGFTPRGGAIPKVEEEEEDEETCAAPLPRAWPSVPKRPRTAVAFLPVSSSAGHHHGDGGTPCTEVAAALDRLAGTYERVESAKQKEATRLEERRLEAMRDLEIERMRILVDVAISASAVAADAATATAASSS